MSDALALVRFPDGDLRAAYYFGSGDAVVPVLFPVDQAESLLGGGMESVPSQLAESDAEMADPADIEDVQIWTSYGAGSWWEGRGSRAAAVLVDGVEAPPSPGVHPGTPDWVPADWR